MTVSTYLANGGITGTSAVTTAAIAYPAGIAPGDIAFLIVHSDNNSVISGPGGVWTQVGAQVNSTTVFGASLYWTRLTGTETGTVTVTRVTAGTSNWFGGTMSAYRGAIGGGTPYEANNTNVGTAATMTGVAVTTLGVDRRVLQFYCLGANIASAPTGSYTEDWELGSAVGNAGLQVGDSQAVATASTVTAPTRTVAGNPWVVFGLALIPAAAPFPIRPLSVSSMHALIR